MKLDIEIDREKKELLTKGLRASGELKAKVQRAELLDGADALLRYIADYLAQSGREIHPEETISYGAAILQFKKTTSTTLELWELHEETFIPGVTDAVEMHLMQEQTCTEYSAPFSPPRGNQLAVISLGVFEGDRPLEGVRYPEPDHMSGWWFTTDRYDGNVGSLQTVHLGHVLAKRPELKRFVALPPGFRLLMSDREETAWFDEEASRDEN